MSFSSLISEKGRIDWNWSLYKVLTFQQTTIIKEKKMYWQYFYLQTQIKRKTKLFWRQFPLYIIYMSLLWRFLILFHKQASPLEYDLGSIPLKFQLYCYKYHKQRKAAHMTKCKNPRLFAINAKKNQIILGEMRLAKLIRSVHIQYFPQASALAAGNVILLLLLRVACNKIVIWN